MPLNSVEDWQEYFGDIGLRKPLISKYLKYVGPLLSKGLPIIFSRKHLAALLGKTQGYIGSVVFGTKSHYREFQIPKRTGGLRLIAAPYPALLECQRWISSNILSSVAIHESAHGYVKGRHIASNVNQHAGAPVILKLDIKDFFPSITLRRVVYVFRSLGYADDVSFTLARLCTLDGKLPQGAATSPSLSNIVARRLDARLAGIALKFELKYSRYADDMTFSGENISSKFCTIASEIISEEGFSVNTKKTKLMSGTGRRIVTGLQINDQVRVPRKFRRELRKEVYFVDRYGYRSHISKIKKPYATYIYSLRGRAAFLNWVESESDLAQKSKRVLAVCHSTEMSFT